jgi:hypothetical protein
VDQKINSNWSDGEVEYWSIGETLKPQYSIAP